MTPPEHDLVERHRGALANAAHTSRGWSPAQYDLCALPEWDEARLPIIVATPRNLHDASSLLLAILPNGQLVTSDDATAFATLARHLAPSLVANDARVIATLAVLFNAFATSPLPVGRLVEFVPVSRTALALPRAEPAASYERHGPQHLVRFYTYNDQLRELFDCIVAIDGASVRAEAQTVERRREGVEVPP